MNNFECADSPHCPAPMTCPFARICGKYQEALEEERYREWLDVQDTQESVIAKTRWSF